MNELTLYIKGGYIPNYTKIFLAKEFTINYLIKAIQHRGYKGLSKKGFDHTAVNHSVGEYINDKAHTNGIESFWSMLKRGYIGVYHKMSVKHLQRYIDEYVGRHNLRPLDTMNQITEIINDLLGKKLSYKELVG